MSQLTIEEKIEILHRIFIMYDTEIDVAKACRVKLHLVKSLKKKIKSNINFIRDLKVKRQEVEQRDKLIVETAENILSNEQQILKSSVVKHKVFEDHQLEVTNKQVCQVMKDQMGMRYKKVKLISYNGNSERNLILR